MPISIFDPTPQQVAEYQLASVLKSGETVLWLGAPTLGRFRFCFVPTIAYCWLPAFVILVAGGTYKTWNVPHLFFRETFLISTLLGVSVLYYLAILFITRRIAPVYALTDKRAILSYARLSPMIAMPDNGLRQDGRIFYIYDLEDLAGADVRFRADRLGNISFEATVSISGFVRAKTGKDSPLLAGVSYGASRPQIGAAQSLVTFTQTRFPGPFNGVRRERNAMIGLDEADKVGRLLQSLLEKRQAAQAAATAPGTAGAAPRTS